MELVFNTERLQMREFRQSDSDFIVKLLNSEGWLRYIGDRWVNTPEDAWQYLQKGPLKSYREHGYGLFLVELTATRSAIGMCGLMKRDNLEYPDIGFAFLPEYGGKGYALEAASEIMRLAASQWDIPVVDAIVLPVNLKSNQLLEKLGMKRHSTIRMVGEDVDLWLYRKIISAVQV